MPMTTRLGTKTWSDAPQESSFKADTNNYGGVGQTGVPEGKDLGTYLNEIADPNYVPPEKTRKVGNNQLDKDAFFKLMLAQVKNQDPINPMKSDQMAAQLAQFTSLEQLMNVNEKLDKLTQTQTPITQYQALNFIGKSVAADTSKVIRGVGDKTHDLRFILPRDVAKARVSIKDSTGQEVRSYDLANLKKGENKVTWNGLDANASATRAGEYYFEVNAEGGRGEKVAAMTNFRGRVTGVNYGTDGVILLVGDQTIRLKDVSKIEDGDAKADEGSKVDASQNLGLQIHGDKKDDKVEGAKPPMRGNLDSIAMSQQVMDQLNKADASLAKEKAAQQVGQKK